MAPRREAATAGTTMPMGIPPTPQGPSCPSAWVASALEIDAGGWGFVVEAGEPDPGLDGRGGGWNPTLSLWPPPAVLLGAIPMGLVVVTAAAVAAAEEVVVDLDAVAVAAVDTAVTAAAIDNQTGRLPSIGKAKA